jgi:hypothetical protein
MDQISKIRDVTAAVLDELEQELLATLAEFDDEAVGLAVLDALERVRVRAQLGSAPRKPIQPEVAL